MFARFARLRESELAKAFCGSAVARPMPTAGGFVDGRGLFCACNATELLTWSEELGFARE
jgi:hypothetical protein